MNQERLKQAETAFFKRYPGGFFDPELQAIAKKHRMEQMVAMAHEYFAPECFADSETIVEQMTKMVSRSSLVSLFEKPRFRDYVKALDSAGKERLALSLKAQLHGDAERGFNDLVDQLAEVKLAKWPLVTLIPNYYRPDEEVFVKPTTVKGVIVYFGLEGLDYNPKPSWDFYKGYRTEIQKMKAAIDPALMPSNAAFCGFLMMSLPK